MKTLYLECTSGISGDMTVAALLDLGADCEALRQGLASLGVEGYSIEIGRVTKSGISACDFHVNLDETHGQHDSHGEDHEHPHGQRMGCGMGRGMGQGRDCGMGRGRGHDHEPGHEHGHDEHEHSHEHGQEHRHSHPHADGRIHRNLGDITALIDASAITPNAKEIAKSTFRIVAEAEAKVHGLPVEQVHFHEVGALDSIADIVGAAICVDNLAVERVVCTPLNEGTGTIHCQHGVIPVPAPATLEIVRSHHIPLIITQNKGEMVTPTGAAIIAALADSFEEPQAAVITAIGYGAGKRDYSDTANVLRASLLEEHDAGRDTVCKLECNLDDMTGEQLAYACEKLLKSGALDVWCTPIQMKKSRPGQLLSVLAPPALEKELARLLFTYTSTIGVRVSVHHRHIMARRAAEVVTPYGTVAIKECSYDGICKTTVEFESAKQLAQAANVPINEIFRAAYHELD